MAVNPPNNRPWRVVTYVPGNLRFPRSLRRDGEKQFTSQVKAYKDVQALMSAVSSGSSPVVRIRIEQWSKSHGVWEPYEILNREELGL